MAKKRVSIPEVTNLIILAMGRESAFADATYGTDNPQTALMRVQAIARIDALEAVLDALHGSFVPLKIMAGR